MKILITGGAGYIGSFMTKRLLDLGNEVVVADSLERGNKASLDERAIIKQGNLCDRSFTKSLFAEDHYDGVIHFAAYISMGESVENPFIYFYNNVQGTLILIEELRTHGQNNFIFSSTAGVYGNPTQIPIPENHPKNPENPYGESKLIAEKILSWYGKTKNLSYVILRYFNAAGADISGTNGEQHTPETHIIPNVISAVMNNRPFKLFGNDYNTPDKTCIRDYIHVYDLVEAHVLALQKLQVGTGQFVYNVGTGQGHSNREVISMIQKIANKEIIVQESPRRPGDADILVADVKKIQQDLGFQPKYSDLQTIVQSAWQWQNRK